MQMGDIVLVQGDGFISEGIRLFTQGGFSHSALATSEDTIIEAVAEGVVEVPMHYDHYAVFRVVDITEEECAKVVAYARATLVGEKYDYNQDIGFATNAFLELVGIGRVPNLFDVEGKLTCGATLDLAFRGGAGIILREDRSPGDVTPVGVSYSLRIRMIENHNLWEI